MSFQDLGTGPGARGQSGSAGTSFAFSTGRDRAGGVRTGVSSQQGGGFGSAGTMRTGGVGISSSNGQRGAWDQGAVGQPRSLGRAPGGAGIATGNSPGGGKVSEYLLMYSQNVNLLSRLVQQLGTTRDTPELRGQCRGQLDVVNELGEKIQRELKEQQQAAEGASRQEAARIGAMNAKLTKDYKRVKAIAVELGAKAERRMQEVDAQRQQREKADKERAHAAFSGLGEGRRQQGALLETQQRREVVQMQEEAVNTAIILETEEELQKINKSLYKVNEIYRDLASIVEQQQEAVEHIESNTEAAHARAQEGLVQVQKANEYQPSCTIS